MQHYTLVVVITMAPTASKPLSWKDSAAKVLALRLLADESSWVHQASIEEVHEREPIFKQYPLKDFKRNYKNLIKRIQEEKACIAFDQSALNKEKELFPRNPTTVRGNPFWDGHIAQTLLAEDVKSGRSSTMKPSELRESRVEYQDFPLPIFRPHVYQEQRKVREGVYWQKKRNDKARKKHEADAEKLRQATIDLDGEGGN